MDDILTTGGISLACTRREQHLLNHTFISVYAITTYCHYDYIRRDICSFPRRISEPQNLGNIFQRSTEYVDATIFEFHPKRV